MAVIDSLKKWFSVVTDPLCGANKVADDLNSAHQDFMRGFASIMTGMMAQQVIVKVASTAATNAASTMSGQGADAILTEATSYLQVGVSVTPTADLALAGAPIRAAAGIGRGATTVSELSEFGTLCETAAADVEDALINAGVQIGEDAALDTVTEVVDAAAVAEAGANPIADAAAIILTIIAAGFFIKTLYDMAWAVYDAIQSWQKAATNACQPLPHLPQSPKKMPAQPSLSQADKDLAKELSQETGVPQSVIEDIISKNPGLSKDEYRLLIKYYQKYKTYPFNVRAIFNGLDQKGKNKIYFVTQGDIDKLRRDHRDDFATLGDEQLLQLIERLLQQRLLPHEEADGFKDYSRRQLLDYYYNNVIIDGSYYTIVVRTSTSTPGRVISIYPEW